MRAFLLCVFVVLSATEGQQSVVYKKREEEMRTGTFVHHNRPRWWTLVVACVASALCGAVGALSWEQEREQVQSSFYYPGTEARLATEGAVRYLTP